MEATKMSQVPVKWVRSKHELWDRQVQANTTSPDMAVPVVPLSALREVVEGLRMSGDYTSDIYNQALNDILASLGEVGT